MKTIAVIFKDTHQKTNSKILPVIFANACAPPTASSSISHSVLVEESIHTGESEIQNAFAN